MNPEPVAKPTDAKPVDVVPTAPEKPTEPAVKPTEEPGNEVSSEPKPSTKPVVKQTKKAPAKPAVRKKTTSKKPAAKKSSASKKRAPSNISPELRKKLADVVTPDEYLGDDPYKGTSKALTPKQLNLMKQQPRYGLSGYEIDDVAAAQLNEIAEIMKSRPKMKLEIGGFGCDKGGPEVTKLTSLGRAESVKRYLSSKGVPANQIVTRAYGLDNPIRSNDDEDGKAANRRVQFKFLPE
jgi:outer membrane protein OmpA-like peptidoglycan-associated protein